MGRGNVRGAWGGDGGDEGFGGYSRYLNNNKIENFRRLVPDFLSRAVVMPVGRMVLPQDRHRWLQRMLLPRARGYQQSMMLFTSDELPTILCPKWQIPHRNVIGDWMSKGAKQRFIRAM